MAKKRVVVFGTFDMLHPGHLWFLKAAKRYGTELVVVVSRDATVRAEKHHRPVLRERERLTMVRALRCVSRAELGDTPGRWTMIRKLKPDVICIGHDQNTKHPALKDHAVRVVRIRAYRRNRYHSSQFRSHQ